MLGSTMQQTKFLNNHPMLSDANYEPQSIIKQIMQLGGLIEKLIVGRASIEVRIT